MEKDISRRIWITRYFMVIGIIVLHLPPYQPMSEMGHHWFDYLRAFFGEGVFRATVPVLTAMSGYLVFYSGLHLKPLQLLKKKTTSVFVPLLLWNIPLVIAVYFVQRYQVLSHDFSAQLHPINFKNWLDALIGLTANPVNYPLNFLRDLFVVSLLSPLYWLLLKRIPYWGFLIVFVIYYFKLEGPLVLRNTMLVSFYIGALAATQQWDLKRLDRYAWPLLMAFVAICIVIVAFKIENREVFLVVSPLIVWPMMSLLAKTQFGDWVYQYSRASFFTFLSHGPIILVAYMVFSKLGPDLPYQIYWFGAPVLTVLLAIGLNKLFQKLTPRIAGVFLGGR